MPGRRVAIGAGIVCALAVGFACAYSCIRAISRASLPNDVPQPVASAGAQFPAVCYAGGGNPYYRMIEDESVVATSDPRDLDIWERTLRPRAVGIADATGPAADTDTQNELVRSGRIFLLPHGTLIHVKAVTGSIATIEPAEGIFAGKTGYMIKWDIGVPDAANGSAPLFQMPAVSRTVNVAGQ